MQAACPQGPSQPTPKYKEQSQPAEALSELGLGLKISRGVEAGKRPRGVAWPHFVVDEGGNRGPERVAEAHGGKGQVGPSTEPAPDRGSVASASCSLSGEIWFLPGFRVTLDQSPPLSPPHFLLHFKEAERSVSGKWNWEH